MYFWNIWFWVLSQFCQVLNKTMDDLKNIINYILTSRVILYITTSLGQASCSVAGQHKADSTGFCVLSFGYSSVGVFIVCFSCLFCSYSCLWSLFCSLLGCCFYFILFFVVIAFLTSHFLFKKNSLFFSHTIYSDSSFHSLYSS